MQTEGETQTVATARKSLAPAVTRPLRRPRQSAAPLQCVRRWFAENTFVPSGCPALAPPPRQVTGSPFALK